jgi:hypothetical protein
MALLWFLLVGSALLYVWSACVQRLSRAAALALLLLPMLFTGRALFTNRVYAPIDLHFQYEPFRNGLAPHNRALSDLHCQIIPWQQAVRASLARGEWPLWNPSILCGDILAAAAQPAVYDPFQWLCLLLPLPLALTFGATITFFLAAHGTFAFARAIGCSERAALVAAAGFMCSGMLAFFVGWPLGRAWALLPLVLFAARAVGREARWRDGVLLTIALALVIVAGHPESLLHIVAVGAVYGFFETRSWRAAGVALAAGIAALLLTAVYLLPFLEAVPQTVEHDIRRDLYAPTSYDQLAPPATRAARIARTFLPFAEADDPLSARAGSIVFALALAAPFAARRRETWFFSALAGVALCATFGLKPVAHLLHALPLFDIAINERLAFAAVFAVSILAALTIDAMNSRVMAICAVTGAAAMLLASRGDVRTIACEALPLLALCAFLRTRHVALAALTLLLLQRTYADGSIYPAIAPKLFYPRTPLVDALPRDGRVAAVGFSLVPNTAAMYGLEDVRGYEAMTNRRLAQTYPLWSQFQTAWFNRIDDPSRPFLSLMNVRAIVDGTRVLENPHALPRAFVPRRVRYERDEANVLEAMKAVQDFGEVAFIETHLYAPHDAPNGPGDVTTRDNKDFDVNLQNPGWVVISNTAWRGWRAYVDGRRVETHFADHAFLGVHVPAGRHRLRLVYLPESFTRGRAISLAALAIAFAGILVRVCRPSSST